MIWVGYVRICSDFLCGFRILGVRNFFSVLITHTHTCVSGFHFFLTSSSFLTPSVSSFILQKYLSWDKHLAFHGKKKINLYKGSFLDFYSWILLCGLWNCHLLIPPRKTSKFWGAFRHSSATCLSCLQQLLAFQCLPDGIYWNEHLKAQCRAAIEDSQ